MEYHLVVTNIAGWKIPTINGGLVHWEHHLFLWVIFRVYVSHNQMVHTLSSSIYRMIQSKANSWCHSPFATPTLQSPMKKPLQESMDWLSRENFNRKPWFLPLNMGVSCKFSLKPIHCRKDSQTKGFHYLINPRWGLDQEHLYHHYRNI